MDLIKDINGTENKGIPIVTFKSLEDLDWLGCGFSTRLGGVSTGSFSSMNMSFLRGDDPEHVMENIRLFSDAAGFDPKNIVMPHQCHTTNVQVVGKKECGRGVRLSLLKSVNKAQSGEILKDIPGTEEEVDGQITDEKGVVLFVLGADCVPVFIVDTQKRVISAVHAGWKGTVENIAAAAVRKMKEQFGCDTKDLRAVIGPSICGDCYEVSCDVGDLFIERYGKSWEIVRPVAVNHTDEKEKKYLLNLWNANRVNLTGAGIAHENIEISGLCTKCHPDVFFSHRAHGNDRGVNIGYIFMK